MIITACTDCMLHFIILMQDFYKYYKIRFHLLYKQSRASISLLMMTDLCPEMRTFCDCGTAYFVAACRHHTTGLIGKPYGIMADIACSHTQSPWCHLKGKVHLLVCTSNTWSPFTRARKCVSVSWGVGL